MWCCFHSLLLVVSLLSGWSFAQAPGVVGPPWSATPFHPPAIPLAVRSPYLNCWARGGNNSGPIADQWPNLWDMSGILGWAIFVRVDGVAYRIMGLEAPISGAKVATQTAFSFTATQSNFVHAAGPVNVTTSFISPIEPDDLVLQSLPAAYLSISIASNDNNHHHVQVYSDITAEWISGDDGLIANWDTTTNSSTIIHSVKLQDPQPFAVVKNHIQDATVYYGMRSGDGVTWQVAKASIPRDQFMKEGILNNSMDTGFRAISDKFPVFALSMDLNTITVSDSPVVFALGLLRDPAIRAVSAVGIPEARSLYFRSQFSTPLEAMNHFISDFPRASSASSSFDSGVRTAALAVSSDYADLIDLSVRQVFGMIEITVGKDTNGNWNTSDVQAFMNDAGPEFVFPLAERTMYLTNCPFPAFLQTNPLIAGALLKPLLQWQQSNGYPNTWAAHDLGTQYPTALGDTIDTAMPIEESANMLIMTLAQARASGDATLIVNYYAILDQWAQYLASNAMNPGTQNFSDSVLTGPVVNDTNLALKGIIGVRAMAEIATAANNSAAATKYSGIASNLLQQWQAQAFSLDQNNLLLNFGNDTSSLGLPYNLYADKLLGLNFIPQKVYDQAAAFVKANAQMYGVALDSRSPSAGKTDWSLFTAAAIMSDVDARNILISGIRKFAASQLASVPFPDFYDVSNGSSLAFRARPVQGAMYSILALEAPSKPIVLLPPTATNTAPSASSPTQKSAAVSDQQLSLLSLISSIGFVTMAKSKFASF